MKRTSRTRRVMARTLVSGCLLAGTGCNEQVAGQWVTLTGNYLGDVVSALATHCFQNALGIEGSSGQSADEHEHEHDGGALHDHQH